MGPTSTDDFAPSVTVVVTGGAGFVGHHLVAALIGQGARVAVIDDLSTGAADRLPPEAELVTLDLVTGELTNMMRAWRPSIVYHLAAQVSVPWSQADPERDLRVNGLGTLRLLEAARVARADRFVFMSSGGAIYGETTGAATEDAPERPESFYGMHKLLAERYVAASGSSYAIARPSNIYGPGQSSGGDGAVVPVFIDAIRGGGPVVVHGDGTQTRDFIYVADVVEALQAIATAKTPGTWNVSSGEATSVLELAETLEELTGVRVERTFMPRRAGDVHTSLLANQRLMQLGWTRRYTLDDGLRCVLGLRR